MAFQEIEQSSSPDPLSLYDENLPSPSPSRIKARQSSVTPRKPLVNVSGNAAVQDFYISTTTPTKGKSRSKGNTDASSPWRIRLTVQADQLNPKGQQDTAVTVSPRLKEHTMTTRIPLKGLENSSPLDSQKRRGRRRRASTATAERNGTPKPDISRRKKSSEEAPDAPDHPLIEDGTPTRRKSRRGLHSADGFDTSLTASRNSKTSKDFLQAKTKPEQPKSRTRRKEITPKKPSEPFDRFSMSSPIAFSTHGQLQPSDAHPLEASPIDDNASETQVRQSSNRHSSQAENEDQPIWEVTRGQDMGPQNIPETRKALAERIADPTGKHDEFDSILESEGFSMVSISSLPSAGLHSASPAEQNGGFPRGHEPMDQKHDAGNTSTISQVAHGYSDISSIEEGRLPFNFASSIHSVADGQTTPADVTLPRSPSAPKAKAVDPGRRLWHEYEDGSAKISRVVCAGTALQKALGPVDGGLHFNPTSQGTDTAVHARSEKALASPVAQMQQLSKTTPEQPTEDPFAGFSGGTRRELRAGLRLGQELAKKRLRQSVSSKSISAGKNNTALTLSEIMNSQSSAQKAEPEQQDVFRTSLVSYPVLPDQQLPSPAHTTSDDEDCMSWRANTPKQVAPVRPSPAPISSGQAEDTQEASPFKQIMLAREAEWQREREAVSRQIEMANSSQVIVIDSDDSSVDLGQTDEQIQCYDSDKESGNTRPESNSLGEAKASGLRQQESPSRGKHSVTTMDNASPDRSGSGLFWLPDDARAKATRRRQGRRKRARDEDVATSSVTNNKSPPIPRWISQEPTSSILSKLVNNSAHDSPETSDSDACVESPRNTAESIAKPCPIAVQFPILTPEDSRCSRDDSLNDDDDEPTRGSADADVRYPSIDPTLFQSQITPAKQPVNDTFVSCDISTLPKSTSWFSALTKPLTALFCATPQDSIPISTKPNSSLPPATKSDILSSSTPTPLSSHHPWTVPHFHALEPLYYAAHLYGAFIFPFNPRSPSARFLGVTMRTSTGWERKANEMDCGVTDAFMFLLSERSKGDNHHTARRPPTEAKIDEEHVLRMCVRIWADMVQRGDVALQRGEVAGTRRQGDRTWRATDIQAADSRKEYFDRKKKEWGGLPSWRRLGLVGM